MRKRLRLKPLGKQVMVITGATSGIGLSTARAACAKGVRLVLAARNEEALKAVRDDLAGKGAQVAIVAADVGREADVRAIAEAAISAFGGFDVWVNNAGVSIFGPISATPLDDQRRLFDTNYWGVVYGSLAAVEHFRDRDGGGVLINIGSTLGDLPLPLQGVSSASKAAVASFTKALRMELMAEHAPVSVTLIKPSAIDTPYKDHARNLTGVAVRNPPPVYATPLVADAILYAAHNHVRELTVGTAGGFLGALNAVLPFAAEPLMAWAAPKLERDAVGRRAALGDNLHHPGQDLRERSFQAGVREASLYSTAQMRPKATLGLAVLAGIAAGVALLRVSKGARRPADAEAAPPPPAPPTRRQRWASRFGLKG
ncbi:MAG: SDR family oxidoreductase [Caulobacteraceae bacterium]|nr:SDR family oxidoreductase [Caulobacteraceae bacterium]